jgi:hypothetical protein
MISYSESEFESAMLSEVRYAVINLESGDVCVREKERKKKARGERRC